MIQKYERIIEKKIDYLKALQEAMVEAFGPPEGKFHLIPKSIWLHPLVDYVATFPPHRERHSWLYATFALSALSDKPVELLIERPIEDMDYGLGNIAELMNYFLEYSEFDTWHSMGPGEVFGEDSPLRGFLFCPPPKALSQKIEAEGRTIDLIYVAGITEKELLGAQKQDDEFGEFRGAKALYEELDIENNGIAYLGNSY